MKKIAIAASAALVGMTAYAAQAQDADTDTDVETETPDSNGAVVTREDIVEQRQARDEEGNPLVDETTNEPILEDVVVGFVQTVETPSGNIHTITKEEGSRAIVTHERPVREAKANRAERAERTERVAKADRPERPERPEKAERAARPERPERPARPARGN